jgi:hypothetical protein
MQCPSCGAGIPDNATRCEFCDRPVDQAPATQRGDVPRPSKFQIDDDGASLRISWRWFSPVVFFLLPFAIAWNAFLIGWYSMATVMPGEPFGMRLVFLVFPIAHVAVGVGLAYSVLALLMNRSLVTVDRGTVTVSHGPLPWPGATVDADRIEQLYCSREERKSDNNTQQSYSLRAKLKDGSTKVLLQNVSASEETLYLEQALEKHLKIRDLPVKGELPRE